MKQLNKSQKRMFFVLGLVFAYGVFDVATNWSEYAGYYSGKSKKKVQNIIINNNVVSINPKMVMNNYTKNWQSDPFYVPEKVKQVVKRSSAPKLVYLKLDAISYANENSVAMINNRILKQGDWISGYKLVRIEPKQVVLSKSGSTRVLALR